MSGGQQPLSRLAILLFVTKSSCKACNGLCYAMLLYALRTYCFQVGTTTQQIKDILWTLSTTPGHQAFHCSRKATSYSTTAQPTK
jgi:hypothetical protein